MHSSLSAPLRKAFRRVTEVNILDEDYRQPVSSGRTYVHPRNLIAADLLVGFCCFRSSHRQSNPPISTVPDVQKSHIQTKQGCTSWRRTMPKRFCPSPSKSNLDKRQGQSRGIIRLKEKGKMGRKLAQRLVNQQRLFLQTTSLIVQPNYLLSEMYHLIQEEKEESKTQKTLAGFFQKLSRRPCGSVWGSQRWEEKYSPNYLLSKFTNKEHQPCFFLSRNIKFV